MRIIDNHDDVMSLLQNQEDQVSVLVEMIGHPAGQRYPDCRLRINGSIIWQGTIIKDCFLEFKNVRAPGKFLNIKIEFFDKEIIDTIVEDGEIKENKRLEIVSLQINCLKIQGHDLMTLSETDYNLTPCQQDAYKKIGSSWLKIQTNIIYDNGVWNLNLSKPIITDFINKKRHCSKRVFECSHQEVLSRLRHYFQRSDRVV